VNPDIDEGSESRDVRHDAFQRQSGAQI
jgi:hypothetical protein